MGNIKRLALQLSIISAVFVAAAGLQTLAFTEPSSAPPTGNVNAPLNTGTAAQEKLGPLWINTSASPGLPTGLLVADGNAVVGTADSSVRTNTPRGYVSAKGFCIDGANCVTSLGGAPDVQTFNYTGGSQTWTKPSSGKSTLVQCWGGGGAGSAAAGGGGGGYTEKMFSTSDLPSTVSITIGKGGANLDGGYSVEKGGNSSFGTYLYAYGGGAGGSFPGYGGGGGGGPAGQGKNGDEGGLSGPPQRGSEGAGGNPGNDSPNLYYGGFFGPAAGYGGGGGTYPGGGGGDALYGGGGGGGYAASGGTSVYGGGGTNGVTGGSAGPGIAPGGGGGNTRDGIPNPDSGGDGRCIVTTL